MDAFIRRPIEEQRVYFEQAQAKFGLPPVSIEKDFWVCWTLMKLFTMPIWREHLTFKGGTSLSKGWGLIERFSEDIDMVIGREFLGFGGENSPERAPSRKQRKKRLAELKEVCRDRIQTDLKSAIESCFRDTMPGGMEWSIELATLDEDPDSQSLLFRYPGALIGAAIYLNPQVKIELGARSDTWPTERPNMKPYLAEAFPEVFAVGTFTGQVVAPERTFWEKAMLLHEETYRPANKPRRARLARHYYDLWCLIRKGVAGRAVENDDLLAGVAEHRSVFFPQSWVDYGTIRRGSLRLFPDEKQIDGWRRDYNAMRGEMFFGEVPDFSEVLRVVREFERAFNQPVY
jgi:hypothetical protein